MFRWVFFAILAVLFFAWLFSKTATVVGKAGFDEIEQQFVISRVWQNAEHPSYLCGSFGDCGIFVASFVV